MCACGIKMSPRAIKCISIHIPQKLLLRCLMGVCMGVLLLETWTEYLVVVPTGSSSGSTSDHHLRPWSCCGAIFFNATFDNRRSRRRVVKKQNAIFNGIFYLDAARTTLACEYVDCTLRSTMSSSVRTLHSLQFWRVLGQIFAAVVATLEKRRSARDWHPKISDQFLSRITGPPAAFVAIITLRSDHRNCTRYGRWLGVLPWHLPARTERDLCRKKKNVRQKKNICMCACEWRRRIFENKPRAADFWAVNIRIAIELIR